MTAQDAFADAALAAFARPIQRHAQRWAAGVLDSLECDVVAGATTSLATGLSDVSPEGEWLNARLDVRETAAPRCGHPALATVPAEAGPWIKQVWTTAYRAAIVAYAACSFAPEETS